MQGKNQDRGYCAGGRIPHRSRQTCHALSPHRKCRGFSLLELLVVLAILLIVSAIAIPTMVRVVDVSQMRGTLGDVSNLAQACRTQAIKSNQSQWLHFTGGAGQVVLFVTPINSALTSPIPGDPKQLSLSTKFSIFDAPTGTGAPSAMSGTTMWGSGSTPSSTDPYFNSRGLPCSPNNTNTCDMTLATQGFVRYFAYSGHSGTLWSAVGISPAGRIKTWVWDGKAWAN